MTEMAEGARFIVCRRVPGHGWFYAQAGNNQTSQFKNAYRFPTFEDAMSYYYKLGDARWSVERVREHLWKVEDELAKARQSAEMSRAAIGGFRWSRTPSSSPTSKKAG